MNWLEKGPTVTQNTVISFCNIIVKKGLVDELVGERPYCNAKYDL